ncbi:class I SAM-dependent methyltransferase [Mesorhizobium sp. 1M-11]|uniref:class I SAM-dependent methyltransferase n=1 Tax=Mesorhizobium sp. 1M-11 TaxID=1529006 RepID=UPI0006C74A33|nr:class I SAM-dependent methyltransferase [Mesorhizobium sp. 1M-11]
MTSPRKDHDHWSDVASEWIEWARAPNHDAFWAYRPALREFIGKGAGDALEVGCGEGRVSRLLRECGYRVTATDTVEAFVAAAREADSADRYEVAPATALPFEPASFDFVMAYNMLMDVDDVPAAVKEMRRVLRPSGTLFVSIVHPFADRGRFDRERPDTPFVVDGTYFGREHFEGAEERDGLRMRFAGWSQPLQNYMAALERGGLAVTSLVEPAPDAGPQWAALRDWDRIPLFLWLKARPLAG